MLHSLKLGELAQDGRDGALELVVSCIELPAGRAARATTRESKAANVVLLPVSDFTYTRFTRLLMALGIGASWNWFLLTSRYTSLVSLYTPAGMVPLNPEDSRLRDLEHQAPCRNHPCDRVMQPK